MSEDPTRYESHQWDPTDDDQECIVCGVTWGECEDDCPTTNTPRQAEDGCSFPGGFGEPGCTPAGRPGGVKSLPLKLRVWHWLYCRWYDADRGGKRALAVAWGRLADSVARRT